MDGPLPRVYDIIHERVLLDSMRSFEALASNGLYERCRMSRLTW